MRRTADRKKASSVVEAQQRRYRQHRLETLRNQAESERKVREALAEKALKQEQGFNTLYSDIVEGHKLADKIKRTIDLEEGNMRNKQYRQFEDWNENVYGKVQSNILRQLDSTDYKQLNTRKCADYQQFLDATNTKGAIFRDIIIESEYDPLEPNRHCIKAKTGILKDPVSRLIDKHYEESSILPDSDDADAGDGKGKTRASRKPKAHQRETLDVRSWGSGKIEATPHGFFAKIMDNGPGPETEARKALIKTFVSKVGQSFDHYSGPVDRWAIDSEFPRGKRTRPQPK